MTQSQDPEEVEDVVVTRGALYHRNALVLHVLCTCECTWMCSLEVPLSDEPQVKAPLCYCWWHQH